MRRGLHIAISLLTVVLLLRPLDCFAAGVLSREAAECCLKGKCAPKANADECCKHTVPDSNLLVTSTAADHSSPLVAFVAVQIPGLVSSLTLRVLGDPVRHPPPRIELAAPSLPLLI